MRLDKLKTETVLKKLRKFASPESEEIRQFVSNFEKEIRRIHGHNDNKKAKKDRKITDFSTSKTYSQDLKAQLKEKIVKNILGKVKNTKKDYVIPERMTKQAYAQYLKTPLWRSIRDAVFRERKTACEGCGSLSKIRVHHTTYKREVLRGESLEGLRVVCESCHDKIHKLEKEGGETLIRATNAILPPLTIEVVKRMREAPKQKAQFG